jgi:hypothetical protein
VARSTPARRPEGHRTGCLDRSADQHVPLDLESTPNSGSSPAADDSPLPAAQWRPAEEETNAAVTSAALWMLLPVAEREQLGLRLSRLVLKAVCPPEPCFKEDP